MGLDIETVVLNVDSRFRDKTIYTKSSKFIYELENPIKNIISIRLSSIELPNLFYTFSRLKGNLTMRINDIRVEIPEGNYCASQMIDYLNERLTDVYTATGLELAFTVDPVSGKVNIAESTKSSSFVLEFEEGKHYSLGHYLGFRKTKYEGHHNYTSESILDVIGDNYIFLKVNKIGRVINLYNNVTYFAKLILNSSKNSVNFDDYSNFISKKYDFLQPVNINRFTIELCDLYGDTIDMNDLDFSMTFEVQVVLNSMTKLRAECAF